MHYRLPLNSLGVIYICKGHSWRSFLARHLVDELHYVFDPLFAVVNLSLRGIGRQAAVQPVFGQCFCNQLITQLIVCNIMRDSQNWV